MAPSEIISCTCFRIVSRSDGEVGRSRWAIGYANPVSDQGKPPREGSYPNGLVFSGA